MNYNNKKYEIAIINRLRIINYMLPTHEMYDGIRLYRYDLHFELCLHP